MGTNGQVLHGLKEETEHCILELELANLEEDFGNYWSDPEFLKLVNDPEFQAKLERACRRVISRFKVSAIYSCEDLQQDVIARFAKWLPQYRGEAQLETLLWRIAYNLLVDQSRNPNEQCCSLEDLEFKGCNIVDQDSESSTTIVDQILIKELIGKLDTDRERSLFTGHFVEGKRLSELALEVGISRQAVYKQLMNIVEKLTPYMK